MLRKICSSGFYNGLHVDEGFGGKGVGYDVRVITRCMGEDLGHTLEPYYHC